MKQLILPIAALALLILTSCDKDAAIDNTFSLPNGVMLSNFIAGNNNNATQTWTVDAEEGDTIIGEQGTRIIIAANSFVYPTVPTPTPVTGNVTVTLIEIYDRADMVYLNKPVMGEIWDDTLSPLVSGGEYYLRISQNGNNVVAPMGVDVYLPADSTGGADPMMAQFDGLTVSGVFAFEEVNPSVNVVQIPVDLEAGGPDMIDCYRVTDSDWGWTNVGHYITIPGDKTKLLAQLPTGFDLTSAEVYISYVGEPRSLAGLDFFESTRYSERFGLIPIGIDVHFIAVAYIDGQLHYAIQDATIEEDHVETITQFHPTTRTELIGLINDLE